MKQLFHEPKYFQNILLHIGIPARAAQSLFLQCVGPWFRSLRVFMRTKLPKTVKRILISGYVQIACETLVLRRMLMDDKEYSNYLEDIRPYREDPVGYLEKAFRDKDILQQQVMKKYQWFRALVCERQKIVASESRPGVEGSPLFSQTAKEIRDIYSRAWCPLRDEELDVLEYFWSWEKKRCENVWEDEYIHRGPSFVKMVEEHGTFDGSIPTPGCRSTIT
ncbi:hypothetical protein HG537_0E06050 [Torulaspora globosa]|uniref:Uncharacterized protein n=1 Tax=Torulaspora globosa TaxID=48254 RepID=A0A7H9HU39_9SACH|nr:hypothetical protein HG537_0E06050 [Torulaspora sp. CBS 2947]